MHYHILVEILSGGTWHILTGGHIEQAIAAVSKCCSMQLNEAHRDKIGQQQYECPDTPPKRASQNHPLG